MSTETTKDLIRRYYAKLDTQDPNAMDEFLSPDCIATVSGAPGPTDLAGFKQFGAGFYAAFPDLRHSIREIVVDGDRAVVRLQITGRHQGDLMGLAATGKQVDFGALTEIRLTDGRISAIWVAADMAGVLQQVGVVPAAASSPA